MIEVEAELWYWTHSGMRKSPINSWKETAYIQESEVKRLLEEAHERGRQQALREEEQRRIERDL